MDTPNPARVEGLDRALGERMERLKGHLEAGLVGRKTLVERLLVTMIAGGHLLLEGAPGLGKTRTVKLLADGLGGSFSRIQCTPDLMPSDLTGTQVFRPETGGFDFVPGPVFHSLVLVDEINRAPPKVQSALLEAMAEGQVTSGPDTRPLPQPFMVVATQNPIEHEGTFPLPEAQLDRFLMHVVLDLPDMAAEFAILDLVEAERAQPSLSDAVTAEQVLAMREDARRVHLSPALKDYIVRLVMATREGEDSAAVRSALAHPVSPRGTLALAAGARARAWLHGRDYAVPEDVAALASDTLAHRMVVGWRALAEGATARGLVRQLADLVQPL